MDSIISLAEFSCVVFFTGITMVSGSTIVDLFVPKYYKAIHKTNSDIGAAGVHLTVGGWYISWVYFTSRLLKHAIENS